MTKERGSTDTLAALIIGIGIGVGLEMAIQIVVPGADAGDLLAFVGALVGVVVTILGTLWLEHHRATSEERDNRKIVLDALKEIRDAAAAARQPRGDKAIADARPARIAAEQSLHNAFEKFIYARHYVPKRDIGAWKAIEDLNTVIENNKAQLRQEIFTLEQAGENEDVFGVNIQIMGQIWDRIEPALTAARQEVFDV